MFNLFCFLYLYGELLVTNMCNKQINKKKYHKNQLLIIFSTGTKIALLKVKENRNV
ncbi:hypothetical protein KB13_228 [beta proteobacterium KB13]|uniref:Uncharacterized protein n=1 Tax=beta proteobacterium KB13 TaxID=314607 RepID=B6BTC8_9PROT|nr:hypothetical protein KB13_228 [beta proteobacterium KB13]